MIALNYPQVAHWTKNPKVKGGTAKHAPSLLVKLCDVQSLMDKFTTNQNYNIIEDNTTVAATVTTKDGPKICMVEFQTVTGLYIRAGTSEVWLEVQLYQDAHKKYTDKAYVHIKHMVINHRNTMLTLMFVANNFNESETKIITTGITILILKLRSDYQKLGLFLGTDSKAYDSLNLIKQYEQIQAIYITRRLSAHILRAIKFLAAVHHDALVKASRSAVLLSCSFRMFSISM